MTDIKGISNIKGTAYKDGVKYFGYGTNYYSLLTDCLLKGISYKKGIDTLAENRIPYARFNCGVYYPEDIAALEKNGETIMREIASYAAKRGVGLIPSFFWNCMCLPDYFDEPLGYWGNTQSKTFNEMLRYTEKTVSALSEYDSIWGWEFGNEFNLNTDLPNRLENIPSLPKNSVRKGRDGSDQLKTDGLISAYSAFAGTVKSLDKYGRIISSGNANLRPSQYNQAESLSWTHDDAKQHKSIISRINSEKTDCISEHIYFNTQPFLGKEFTVQNYVDYLSTLSKELGKILFIGEFGDCGLKDGDKYGGYKQMCKLMQTSGVQLAMVWNYDPSENTEFSFGNNGEKQRYIFEAIRETNAAFKNS